MYKRTQHLLDIKDSSTTLFQRTVHGNNAEVFLRHEERPASGVNCSKHSDGVIMTCSECRTLWSPCCGQTPPSHRVKIEFEFPEGMDYASIVGVWKALNEGLSTLMDADTHA